MVRISDGCGEEEPPSARELLPVPDSTKRMGAPRRSTFKAGQAPTLGTQESFFRAARSGDAKRLQEAVCQGADVNFKADRGLTPLMLAATSCSKHRGPKGTIGAMEMLIQLKADIHATDDQGWTVIHHASRGGQQEVIDFLLKHGALLRSRSRNETVITFDKKSPLILAAIDGNEDVVRKLLVERADVDRCDEDGWTALSHACEAGNMGLVSTLLKETANPNIDMDDGQNPLIKACSMGFIDIVQALIKHRADINAVDQHGDTPLMLSLKERNSQLVEVLMHKRPNLEVTNMDGDRAIDISYKMNMIPVHKHIKKRMGILHY